MRGGGEKDSVASWQCCKNNFLNYFTTKSEINQSLQVWQSIGSLNKNVEGNIRRIVETFVKDCLNLYKNLLVAIKKKLIEGGGCIFFGQILI